MSILMITCYPPAPCLLLCACLLPLKDQESAEGCVCSFTIDSSSESNKVSGTIKSSSQDVVQMMGIGSLGKIYLDLSLLLTYRHV